MFDYSGFLNSTLAKRPRETSCGQQIPIAASGVFFLGGCLYSTWEIRIFAVPKKFRVVIPGSPLP